MPLLLSSDKIQVSVSEDVGMRSGLIREGVATGAGGAGDPIPVKVSSDVLEKVLQYCEHYKLEPIVEANIEIPRFTEPRNRHKILSQWDTTFLQVDIDTLMELILAARELKIPDLLDMTCQTAAELMKGKGLAALVDMFKIHDEFTPQEEPSKP